MGVPRELPPSSDRWLNTDCMWGGGDPAHFGDAIRLTDPSVFLSTNHPTRCVRIVYEVLQTMG
jgi:hypothetical protein